MAKSKPIAIKARSFFPSLKFHANYKFASISFVVLLAYLHLFVTDYSLICQLLFYGCH